VLTAAGFTVGRNQVALTQPIKTIGLHSVAIVLHPEVESKVTINVARSEDEAERQARGEDLTVRVDEVEEEEEAPSAEEAAVEEAVENAE
jgi:large subunit ribosomal protein L9